MSGINFTHVTVLAEELVQALNLSEGKIAVDCTAGGGGHTRKMLEKTGDSGKVFGIDRDPLAIRTLQERFSSELAAGRLSLIREPFSSGIENVPGKVDAIGADLGVSSPQLDLAERGFSLMQDGPLDMRMNPDSGIPASEIVAEYSKAELTDLFRKWGEEPKAKFIADAIVKQRDIEPITRTLQLAEIVKRAVHYKTKSQKHPATRVFQALRICVNEELAEVEKLLEQALDRLKPGGRLGVITFHSLEDRIVKQFFKRVSSSAHSRPELKGLPLTEEQMLAIEKPQARIVRPFPVTPTDKEIGDNPRARSAKLRILEKMAATES